MRDGLIGGAMRMRQGKARRGEDAMRCDNSQMLMLVLYESWPTSRVREFFLRERKRETE